MVVPYGLWAPFYTYLINMCYNVHTKCSKYSIYYALSINILCSENTDHIYRDIGITTCVIFISR